MFQVVCKIKILLVINVHGTYLQASSNKQELSQHMHLPIYIVSDN